MIGMIGKDVVALPDGSEEVVARKGMIWAKATPELDTEYMHVHGRKVWYDNNKYIPKSLKGKVVATHAEVTWL